ncbi:hypothetical protein HZH66_013705 [Vespula vulgaris]|uniref:Uncharacterized protein n=1 Tax=Vespula vulgaris TaxID=7454 RepID=A0A834J5F9_VESVU|nr:hypothetical protein HZH66_013705 [Vespula vulgaris]
MRRDKEDESEDSGADTDEQVHGRTMSLGSARIFVRFEGPLERYEIVGATRKKKQLFWIRLFQDRYKPGVVPTAAPQQPLNSAALPSRARSILSLTGLVISPANVRWASHQRRSAALRGNSQEEM